MKNMKNYSFSVLFGHVVVLWKLLIDKLSMNSLFKKELNYLQK